MNIMEEIMKKARECPEVIVLPEAEDERILKAAEIAVKEKIAYPVLLGDENDIQKKAAEIGVELKGLKIINPKDSPDLDRYVSLYCKIRESKRINERIARRILSKNLYFGAMMVRAGDADGMVAGAINLSASVIRAGGLIIELQKDISVPSSFFVMDIPNFEGGENGVLIFADAAVNPDPDASQLADIAIASARSAKTLLGWEPRVAMLSFSTKGSAHHALTRKVVEATEIAKKKAPDLLIDGELQADAAIVPEVAKRKVKEESPVAGRANVLIFPDLNAANIAYKLVQHTANAAAYGPILQGFRRPISDLSRGAKVNDIVGAIAIVCIEARGEYE